MFAYISRVLVENYYADITDSFAREMLYDWGTILWDAIPITMLLVFHYKNFRPYQHELIIRMQDDSIGSVEDSSQQDMLLIQDGMMGQVVVSHDSIRMSTQVTTDPNLFMYMVQRDKPLRCGTAVVDATMLRKKSLDQSHRETLKKLPRLEATQTSPASLIQVRRASSYHEKNNNLSSFDNSNTLIKVVAAPIDNLQEV